jgi:tetratricopeptide (TPR) repeat protein
MKKILFTCFVWLFACNVFAQTVNVDSLVNVLETKNLTAQEQMEIYKKLCFEYEHKNIDKFGQYAEKGFLIANNENEKVYISDFHRYMGISCEHYGHTDSAMMYYKKGLKLAVETTNKECEAILYTKLSNLHTNKRQYKDNDLAWEYLMEALQIAEKIENKEIYVLVLLSIGNYHGVVRNTERAGDYVERAKAVAEKINYDYGKIVCYYTLGDFYHACSKDDKAMEYVLKSLELSMKIGNKSGEIASLQILTYICCLGTGELTKAEKYATKCLMEAEKFGDQGLLIGAYTVLSYVYVYQKRYDECKEAVFKAWNIDSLNIHLSTLGNLAAAYMFSGDLDKAYSFFVNYITLFIKSTIGLQSFTSSISI